MSYLAIKYVHFGTVIASFSLFFLRGLWMMAAPEKLAARWVRVVPHVIDTVLLASVKQSLNVEPSGVGTASTAAQSYMPFLRQLA